MIPVIADVGTCEGIMPVIADVRTREDACMTSTLAESGRVDFLDLERGWRRGEGSEREGERDVVS